MERIKKTLAAMALCASIAILLTLGASQALADSITSPSNPDAITDSTNDVIALASTYTDPAGSNTYQVNFTIDTTAYNGPAGGYIDEFSLLFPGATSVTIDSGPGGDWSIPSPGHTSANGCLWGNGGNWCSQAASGLTLGGPGAVYTWILDVTLPAGDTFASMDYESEVNVVAGTGPDITNDMTNSGKLVSAYVTVPEPNSLMMLLGTGLLSLAGFLRRKVFA